MAIALAEPGVRRLYPKTASRKGRSRSELQGTSHMWVISVVSAMSAVSPLLRQEPTSSVGPATSEKCQGGNNGITATVAAPALLLGRVCSKQAANVAAAGGRCIGIAARISITRREIRCLWRRRSQRVFYATLAPRSFSSGNHQFDALVLTTHLGADDVPKEMPSVALELLQPELFDRSKVGCARLDRYARQQTV